MSRLSTEKMTKLLNDFYVWYKDAPHHEDCQHPFTKDFINNSSNDELIEKVFVFAYEGGKIQTQGYRTAGGLKESVSKNPEEFRRYLKQMWEKNFDVVKWFDDQTFKGWGKGIKTIFLHRVFPDKYIPYNNKTIEGLELLGYDLNLRRGATEGEKYLKALECEKEIVEMDPKNLNLFRVDHLMHYIIGTEEGKNIAEMLKENQQAYSNFDYWIFQGNPEYYDAVSALRDGNLKTFSVKVHKEKVKKGDKAILWLTGENAGCYAFATVSSNIYVGVNDDEELKYFVKRTDNKPEDICRITFDKVIIDNPVLKKNNEDNLILKGLKCGNSGTNFIATKEQYDELLRIANGGGKIMDNKLIDVDLNTILYGPPGTGKTYNIVNRCLEIIDKEKYKDIINNEGKRSEAVQVFKKLVEDNKIVFCTFHQSYGYEEFIEGLRINEKGGFEVKDGIFKRLCNAAKISTNANTLKYDFDESKINFHKMSLGNTNDGGDEVYEYCLENNLVALGWGGDIDYKDCKNKDEIKKKYVDKYKEENFAIDALDRFVNWIKPGDITIISQGNFQARAIAKITGTYFYDKDAPISYKHFRKVEWLHKDLVLPVEQILKEKQFSQQSIYMFGKRDLNIENIKALLSKVETINNNRYIIIIDEINRGNISKIFGELITLIESDKRIGNTNEIFVTLPYSNEKFGVPNNVHIVGTMNTADRSIALIDTALRRRFNFIEMMPNYSILSENIEGINVRKFLEVINERIEYLFDRDHVIGQAYFIKKNMNFNDLVNIVVNKVIPLLQEYFYEDWEKIEIILGGAGSPGSDNHLLIKEKVEPKKIFKNYKAFDGNIKQKYTIVSNPTKEAFQRVYSDVNQTEDEEEPHEKLNS